MPRIVFIHGIGQAGKSPDKLREEWLPGLVAGAGGRFRPADWETVFPFYGDIMGDYMAAAGDAPVDVLTRGPDDDAPLSDVEAIQTAILLELVDDARARGLVTAAEVAAALGDPELLERGLTDLGVVHGLIRLLSMVPGLQGAGLRVFTREVGVYIDSPLAREDAITAVVNALKPPCVVVGHSLGTVVGYEALRRFGAGPADVPLFATLGSPLGITTIRRALEPIAWPGRVAAWFNARDARDVVAMFGLGPEVFYSGRTIEDPGPVHNHGVDSHNIAGYLAVPKVADRIMRAASTLSR